MPLEDSTLGDFLDTLAAKSPAPGGGAVAGLCGAVGAALASMVVAYSHGKKNLAEHAPLHEQAANHLTEIRATMLDLAQRDEQAYSKLNTLQRLPAEDPARADLPVTIREAIDVPAGVVRAAHELLQLLDKLTDKSNKYLLSDLAIAAVLAEATATAGAWNVRVNAPLAAEAGIDHEGIANTPKLARACRELRAKIESACA